MPFNANASQLVLAARIVEWMTAAAMFVLSLQKLLSISLLSLEAGVWMLAFAWLGVILLAARTVEVLYQSTLFSTPYIALQSVLFGFSFLWACLGTYRHIRNSK